MHGIQRLISSDVIQYNRQRRRKPLIPLLHEKLGNKNIKQLQNNNIKSHNYGTNY